MKYHETVAVMHFASGLTQRFHREEDRQIFHEAFKDWTQAEFKDVMRLCHSDKRDQFPTMEEVRSRTPSRLLESKED